MKEALSCFHTFKDVFFVGRAGEPAKAKGNALRKELVVRARMPVFGLIARRMMIIGIRLPTWMRVIVDEDV